jgi:pilus assembly protein TadC
VLFMTITLTRVGQLSATGLLSAGFAGLAVLLALRHPAGQLRRMAPRTSRLAAAAAPVVRLLRGRPDAPPLIRRTLVSMACALGLGLAGVRMNSGHGVIWLISLAVPVFGVAVVLALGWLEPRSARRRRQQLITEVPQTLELLAACLAAGLPVRTACAAVVQSFDGAVADDLGQVLSLMDLGVADAEAWRTLHDHPQLGLAAADLSRSVESGTSTVEGLQHHAAAGREARRGALQVRARAVGVRSVLPMMMCFIPSFMLLGIVPAVVSAVFTAFS